ncbi:hypothetical protein VQ042_06550 [Aurantimonas sp. A2-1-M11]|uniref:hypothetical protein n=1 Tax=Aurantimonas sp. A2-1-M11 TaxID=3113712 RepID=UPI002F947530
MTMTKGEKVLLFRSLISLCGLSQVDAAEVLGRSHDSVRQKSVGGRAVLDRDLEILRGLWLRIDRGDDSLYGRPAEHAEAIKWARGVSKIDTSGDSV